MLKVAVVVAVVAVPTLFGVVGVLVATYILVVDAEIRLVVPVLVAPVVALVALESSVCARLGDVQVGSPIVQALQIGVLVQDEEKDLPELCRMRC